MAISPGIVKFVNTTCVEKALAEEWDGELVDKLDGLATRICGYIICIFSLGLLAPLFFKESCKEKSSRRQTQVNFMFLFSFMIPFFFRIVKMILSQANTLNGMFRRRTF